MIIIPLQYDKHMGPDSIGQHKITFTMDESVATDFNPMSIKKGTQFMVMMIPIDSVEFDEFRDESPEELSNRFRRMFEATIGDIAVLHGVTKDEYRNEVKQKLIGEGLITSSTKELTVEQLGKVIARLKEYAYKLQHRSK